MKTLTLLLAAMLAFSGAVFAQVRVREKPSGFVSPSESIPEPFREATSTPKMGDNTIWVMRIDLPRNIPHRTNAPDGGANFPDGGANGNTKSGLSFLRFYQTEKKQSLAGASLRAAEPKPFLGYYKGWSISHADVSKLGEFLNKFTDWSEVARKNNVTEVHKEIGVLPTSRDTLYFHVGKEGAGTKNCIMIKAPYGQIGLERKLRPDDVSSLLELIDKLPALEAKIPGNSVPNKATDALFK